MNALPSKFHGRTAIEGAAEHGRIDMVDLFLKAGANIIRPGRSSAKTPMQLAEENGHFATLELLTSYRCPDGTILAEATPTDCPDFSFWGMETEEGFIPWSEVIQTVEDEQSP